MKAKFIEISRFNFWNRQFANSKIKNFNFDVYQFLFCSQQSNAINLINKSQADLPTRYPS